MSKEKVELIEDSFKASRTFLNHLLDHLQKKLDAEVKTSESKFNYKDQDWALSQADSFGYRRCLRDTLNMFKEIKND